MEQDRVDHILSQWARERPDLDAGPMGIVGRISRLAKLAKSSLESVFAQHGLTSEGFDVLATLRRAGSPFRLSPTQLFRQAMVSSGTMTNRLDRLEAAGHIVREPDPEDRRGTLIELTPAGREVLDRALVDHLANERRLLEALTPDEQEALVELLRKLSLSWESTEV